MRALPLTFLPLQGGRDYVKDEGDEILVHLSLFDHWVDLYEGKPMLAMLSHHEAGIDRLVCIGHQHTEETDVVYVPRWILENLASDMTGNTVLHVQPWFDVVPSATHLVLRSLDPVPPYIDLRAAIEAKLDRYHVIETGSTLSLYSGIGSEITVYVERTEPEFRVSLGGEVSVEFIEERVPTPIPDPPAIIEVPADELVGSGAGAGAGAGTGATDRNEEAPVQTAEERMAAIRASWIRRMGDTLSKEKTD